MKEKITKTLYALRAANKITSKEMAFRLGISQAQYSKFETGEKDVSLQKLKEIADVFNLKLPTLLALILENDSAQNKRTQNVSFEKIPDIPSHLLEQIFQPSFVSIYREYLAFFEENT